MKMLGPCRSDRGGVRTGKPGLMEIAPPSNNEHAIAILNDVSGSALIFFPFRRRVGSPPVTCARRTPFRCAQLHRRSENLVRSIAWPCAAACSILPDTPRALPRVRLGLSQVWPAASREKKKTTLDRIGLPSTFSFTCHGRTSLQKPWRGLTIVASKPLPLPPEG